MDIKRVASLPPSHVLLFSSLSRTHTQKAERSPYHKLNKQNHNHLPTYTPNRTISQHGRRRLRMHHLRLHRWLLELLLLCKRPVPVALTSPYLTVHN